MIQYSLLHIYLSTSYDKSKHKPLNDIIQNEPFKEFECSMKLKH